MRIGIHYANFTHPDWDTRLASRLTETAKVADQGGAAMFTVMDHYFQMEPLGGPPEPMLEGYTTLGYLAAVTENVRLSLLVTGTTYRHPGLLAKIVTTLDVLSGGRAMLGIGAAWYDREHLGLGVPFPSTSERFERLEETLQIVRQMWSDDNGAYDGRHYQLAETFCVPPPVQQPHPPILIGGGGERKTLRLVAQYADLCNIFREGTEETGRKLDVLRRHCDDVGRDYDEIQKTMVNGIGGADPVADPDAFVAEMAGYADLGIELVTLMPPTEDPVGWTTAVCEGVLPRLAEL
ncbi:LLM class F420-dependent oxidoreductase [Nocardioides sp. Root1257]|uniref:LLM class F420-dependent oxidoreductase n=1 Tax=unclassified Nocardioides TaxID=2615069 RepID=UPI0006FE7238|nr:MULTISPECIES: LLM class F420-dependent oxidoreductase [unclassified Nocardioides]KQW52952.1 LLM class F420-dependent oxidoreductase [Nocardioides sp. Root1257]KRC55640.1 LLM class F420-dependent oxidoreductase [Nocardioides sp. Root224]